MNKKIQMPNLRDVDIFSGLFVGGRHLTIQDHR